jgi:predicted peptidase
MRPLFAVLLVVVLNATVLAAPSEPQLLRVTYPSPALKAERDYFVYLPPGFEKQEKWPVILFLHGNGQRGDGKGELDYVLEHGPLFEAWCQRRDLPFVIIAPQMPMQDQGGLDYIKERTPDQIPRRKPEGTNPLRWFPRSQLPMDGVRSEPLPAELGDLRQDPRGWNILERDLLAMIDTVIARYRGDPRRVYLTGLSLGGEGSWALAAAHPARFAAVAPVVGYGPPSVAPALVAARLPVWVFAGGRDTAEPLQYFYPLVNELERLGHPGVRFTIEADLGHDAWMRVYAGQDLYDWFLAHSK